MKIERVLSSLVRRVPALACVIVGMASIGWADRVSACNTCGCCRVEGFSDAEYIEVGQSRAEAADSPGKGADALPIEPGSWTLVIMPDTQHYSETAAYLPHFKAQTQWIVDHEVSHNIKYVLHEGDVVNVPTATQQWVNARAALDILNDKVPYAIAPGNHDYGTAGTANNRQSLFHQPNNFGPGTPYATQPSIGGFFEAGKTDNSYHTFNAGGNDWLVLALEFGPRDEVVQWANDIVEAHPDHKAMLVTHAYMYYDDTIYDWATKGATQQWNPHSYGVANQPGGVNDGQELWDELVKGHENFRFVFNGHVLADGVGRRATLGDAGNVVHQILANYQINVEGGQGDMRLLEFKPDGETVVVRTYSPSLDRYDTAPDQEFTISMNQLPPSPPVLRHAVAANLVATGPTDPAANTVDSVLVPQSSEPGVSLGQINRGDYQVFINGTGLTYQQGILLASITEHDRPDFVNRRATVEPGRNPYGDGLLSLSIMEAGNAADNEVNFNTSVAWFGFETGWQGAHVNVNGTLAPGAFNQVTQSMVARTGLGRYSVDLGVDSRTDGLLFVIANNNDNVTVQTGPFDDGNGWDIRVEDNATNHAATGEDREWSFVYLPYNTEGLVGGYYDGLANSNLTSSGDFTMNRLATGQYELTLPGETPETGMLILSVAHRATSTVTAPDDNILTYEASPTGSFLINSYDLPALGFQDTKFVWAFLSFENPLSPFLLPGDFNDDGIVDAGDYQVWRAQFGQAGQSLTADGNRDGIVDAADYVVWRKGFNSALGANASGIVPEPATIVLGVLAASVVLTLRVKKSKPSRGA
jgi:hypothetical protein